MMAEGPKPRAKTAYLPILENGGPECSGEGQGLHGCGRLSTEGLGLLGWSEQNHMRASKLSEEPQEKVGTTSARGSARSWFRRSGRNDRVNSSGASCRSKVHGTAPSVRQVELPPAQPDKSSCTSIGANKRKTARLLKTPSYKIGDFFLVPK